MTPRPSNLNRRLMLALKVLIFLSVAAGIAYTLWKSWGSFRAHDFSLLDIDLRWFAVACASYIMGTLPCWLFWHQTLRAMGQKPTLWETFRAYYIGHLGKYVPGKAMVVVLRTGWIRNERVDTTVAATSVFVETLTMMAVGAFVAALILAVSFRGHWAQLALAVALMLLAGIPTVPPIFRRLVRWAQVKRANPNIETALNGLNYPLMAFGWVMIGGGWLVLGLGLWATLMAMTSAGPAYPQPTLSDVPIATACTALAIVAGFLSLIPGGLGVRELVLIPLLAPRFATAEGSGEVEAFITAVLLRLAWLVSEVTISTILYLASRMRRNSTPTPSTRS